MKSTRSLLISAKYEDSSKKLLESDIHVNLWKQSNELYYLDLGIMFYDVKSQTTKVQMNPIQLYLPFECDKCKIDDLGKNINNDKTISTIFNDELETTSGPNKSSMTKCYNKNYSFYLFELGEIDYNVVSKNDLNGSFLTITIPIPSDLENETFNLYIRFRITIDSTESIRFLKQDEHISNNILQAAFSRMELYDFRLNDIRNTDDKVYQDLTKNNYKLVTMRKVHFFFMTNAKDHVSNGNEERMDTRMLEIEKWKNYLNKNMDHALIAYHWKKKRELESESKNISSFEVFFRNTCNNTNIKLVLSYLFFIVALGMTSSLLSTINPSMDVNWLAIGGNALLYLFFLLLYKFGK